MNLTKYKTKRGLMINCMKKGKRIVISFLPPTLLITCLIFVTNSNLFLTNTMALWFLAWVYYLLFYNVFTIRLCVEKINSFGMRKVKLSIIALLISVCVLLLFPYKYGKVLTDNYVEKMRYYNPEVTIVPETGGEISIISIKVNKKDYNIYEIPIDNENWVFDNGRIYNDGNHLKPLTISFDRGTMFDVKFEANMSSANIKICNGKYSYILNMNFAEGSDLQINWETLYGKIRKANSFLRMVYYIICLLLIWSIVEVLVILGYSQYKKRKLIAGVRVN